MTIEIVLSVLSALLIISIMAGKTGYRLGVPVLLLFLCVGMLAGSDGFGLKFNNVKEAQWIGVVALSVILFTGGMDTRFADIKPVWREGAVLSTLGVLLTTILTGLFIWGLTEWGITDIHFTLPVALLLAATMSSTDSASVFAILRSQRIHLKENLRPMLELESGSNDPMAYMLTIVLIQWITSTGMGAGEIALSFVVQFGIGILAGVGVGYFISFFLNHVNWYNPSLYPILILAFTFLTYSLTSLVGGNGFLAVYIAGMIVGNKRIPHRRATTTFMDGMTWLFQIVMFLTLGLLVNPLEMLDIAPVGALIAVFIIVLGRPLSVWLCLLPFRRLSNAARSFVSWVGLRGAVPIIFATYPVLAKVEGSREIFNIVFFVTLISLIVQGMSISRIASFLGLSSPQAEEGNAFGVEMPEDLGTSLYDLVVTEKLLEKGNTLKEINLPHGTLVVMVRRGGKHLVPGGSLQLKVDDTLLVIKQEE